MPINHDPKINKQQIMEKIINDPDVNKIVNELNEFLWQNPYRRMPNIANANWMIKNIDILKEKREITSEIATDMKEFIEKNIKKPLLPKISDLPNRKKRDKDNLLPITDLRDNPLTEEEISMFTKELITATCIGLANIKNIEPFEGCIQCIQHSNEIKNLDALKITVHNLGKTNIYNANDYPKENFNNWYKHAIFTNGVSQESWQDNGEYINVEVIEAQIVSDINILFPNEGASWTKRDSRYIIPDHNLETEFIIVLLGEKNSKKNIKTLNNIISLKPELTISSLSQQCIKTIAESLSKLPPSLSEIKKFRSEYNELLNKLSLAVELCTCSPFKKGMHTLGIKKIKPWLFGTLNDYSSLETHLNKQFLQYYKTKIEECEQLLLKVKADNAKEKLQNLTIDYSTKKDPADFEKNQSRSLKKTKTITSESQLATSKYQTESSIPLLNWDFKEPNELPSWLTSSPQTHKSTLQEPDFNINFPKTDDPTGMSEYYDKNTEALKLDLQPLSTEDTSQTIVHDTSEEIEELLKKTPNPPEENPKQEESKKSSFLETAL